MRKKRSISSSHIVKELEPKPTDCRTTQRIRNQLQMDFGSLNDTCFEVIARYAQLPQQHIAAAKHDACRAPATGVKRDMTKPVTAPRIKLGAPTKTRLWTNNVISPFKPVAKTASRTKLLAKTSTAEFMLIRSKRAQRALHIVRLAS